MKILSVLLFVCLSAVPQTYAPPYVNSGGLSYGPLHQLVPPGPVSGWTWVNQGPAIVDSASGELTMASPAFATDSIRALVRSAMTPPYEVYARIRSLSLFTNYQNCGLLFRESSTGKMIAMLSQFNSYWSSTSALAYVYKYINNTTLANPGAYVTAQPLPTGTDFWWRMVDDGTNLSWWICMDKSASHCVQYGNFVSRTDFLASGPDQIGFYVDPINSSYGMSCSLVDWDVRSNTASLTSPTYTYYGFTGYSLDTFTTASSSDGLTWHNTGGSWSGQINAPQLLPYNGSMFLHVAVAYDDHLNYPTWKIGKMGVGNVVTDLVTVDWTSFIQGLYSVFSGVPYRDSTGVHIFIPASISDLAHFSIYETHATHADGTGCTTDCDLIHWSAPQSVSVDTSNIYDSAVWNIGGSYYMWFTADTTNHYIGLAKSSALLGPYTTLHLFTEWGKYHEGPTMYSTGVSSWRLAVEDISHNYDYLGPSLNQMYSSDCDNVDIGSCTWTALRPWHEDRLYRHGFVQKNN